MDQRPQSFCHRVACLFGERCKCRCPPTATCDDRRRRTRVRIDYSKTLATTMTLQRLVKRSQVYFIIGLPFVKSPERMEISQIGKTRDRQRFLPSGELWSTNNEVGHVSLDSPKSTYSEDHILAPKGCCRLKLAHALEIDQGLLAHIAQGTEAPKI